MNGMKYDSIVNYFFPLVFVFIRPIHPSQKSILAIFLPANIRNMCDPFMATKKKKTIGTSIGNPVAGDYEPLSDVFPSLNGDNTHRKALTRNWY